MSSEKNEKRQSKRLDCRDEVKFGNKVVWVKKEEAESKMGIEFISKSKRILAEYLKAKRSN